MLNIQSVSRKGNFVLVDDNRQILQLAYENWYSSKAQISISGKVIAIKPKNFWHSKYIIYENNLEKGSIGMNWKGQIMIHVIDLRSAVHEFILKAKWSWKQQYELYGNDKAPILTFVHITNWKKFNSNYQVEILNTDHLKLDIFELIAYCGYGLKLYRDAASSG